MILFDKQPLEVGVALNDRAHKLHDIAKLYDETLAELHEKYKNGYIRFKRPGYPKHTRGADAQGREIEKMAEPVSPWRIPLQANVPIGNTGKHIVACCLDHPEVLPNGLWDLPKLSSRKGLNIKEDRLININEEPDLAFFLYKISPAVHGRKGRRKGIIQIVDPKKDDEELGVAERMLTERKYAVWNRLQDEGLLKTMARAYGVSGVDDKQPNAIRKELEKLLEKNDDEKKRNPVVKGTEEFLAEMKITDSLLLRNFIQKAIDEKKLGYKDDGRWRIGNKIIVQVPHSEITRRMDYLCNYLMAGNNQEKLVEFIKDLINKEYLDTITENKEWLWLANVGGFNPAFKKIKDIQDKVREIFCPV